jgi:prepilin-type N-terminal cleavage/methylation domain-containing protein
MTARFARTPSDDGMTMIEMLVAIILASMVSAVVLSATLITHQNLRTTDDEVRGQEDVAIVTDRLSRDLRDARGVVCDGALSDPTCANHLQLWIDANSDYRQEPDEVVTWQLQANTNDPGHYNMMRTVLGSSVTEARTIVRNVAFTYDVAPPTAQPAPGSPTTRRVTVTMYYDAVIGSGTSVRTLTFTTLLRNVP